MDNLTFENLNLIVLVVLPGFITRNLIDIISPPKKYQQFIYVTRCIFYGLLSCFIIKSIPCINTNNRNTICAYLLLFVVSIVLGIAIGIIKQYKCINILLSKIGIKSATPTPSAWDDLFSGPHTGYIIVTLIDGTIIKGSFQERVIAGDEARDLYLEKPYFKTGKNNWKIDGAVTGIYIAENQISRIEFLKENDNEK